jgi:hypothetical protein
MQMTIFDTAPAEAPPKAPQPKEKTVEPGQGQDREAVRLLELLLDDDRVCWGPGDRGKILAEISRIQGPLPPMSEELKTARYNEIADYWGTTPEILRRRREREQAEVKASAGELW